MFVEKTRAVIYISLLDRIDRRIIYIFMRGCGVGVAVFGWRWSLLYAAPNTLRAQSKLTHCSSTDGVTT